MLYNDSRVLAFRRVIRKKRGAVSPRISPPGQLGARGDGWALWTMRPVLSAAPGSIPREEVQDGLNLGAARPARPGHGRALLRRASARSRRDADVRAGRRPDRP